MRLYNFLKDEFNLTKSKLNDFLNGHLILIDGKKASLQSKFEEGNILTIDNKEYKYKEKEYVYFAYNKPIGITCTLDKDKKDSIVNYINYKERIFPIGRLDKDSHGLIILTNDFKAPNIYLNKDNHVEKEYLVKVINKIDENFIKNIEKPILLDNKYTKECIAYLVDD